MRWVRFATTLIPLFLVGCGLQVYVAPTGDLGGYSKITITNRSKLLLDHHLYEDSSTCMSRVLFARGDEYLLPQDGTRTFYVKRGELTTVWAAWAVAHHSYFNPTQTQCTLTPTLVPTADAYEMVFESLDDATRCRFAVFEGAASEGRRVPPSLVLQRIPDRKILGFADGPWCKALTPAQLATLGLKPPQSTPAVEE